LQVLRDSVASETVALVYLDPPFNSNASYNVLFRSPEGERSHAQIEAFEDTWHWTDEAEIAFDEVLKSGHADAAEMLRAMRQVLKENDMMAYLTMMAVRLIELQRVLKPTGSLYLHCDPTASHYLKVMLDGIFGAAAFCGEIVWKRTTAHSDARGYGSNIDMILYYAKSDGLTFNAVYQPYTEEYKARFRQADADGRRWADDNLTAKGLRGGGYDYEYKGVRSLWRCPLTTMQRLDREGRLHFTNKGGIRLKRYLDELPGMPCQSLWDDIAPINSQAKERLGYPTQKPLTLLERIIQASSNEGDTVLDPFCGCGTTIHAAEKLRRQWIGIDITHLSISLIEKRLRDAFPGVAFEVHGTPKDLAGARALAAQDKYQFQWWAVSLVNAVPYGGKKKGADGGIDGFIYFKPDGKTSEKAIVSVKGGDHVAVTQIRDLCHVVERERAKIGVFITLAEPTAPMTKEALKAGFFEANGRRHPKIQILTIEQLFAGQRPDIPLVDTAAFRRATPEDRTVQQKLDL
jgi:site-specific DNA-methyltransferase (adenine-specific)